jgi:hypothetical protein
MMTDTPATPRDPSARVDAAGQPLPPESDTATDADADLTEAEKKAEAEAARLGDFA